RKRGPQDPVNVQRASSVQLLPAPPKPTASEREEYCRPSKRPTKRKVSSGVLGDAWTMAPSDLARPLPLISNPRQGAPTRQKRLRDGLCRLPSKPSNAEPVLAVLSDHTHLG